MQNNQTSAATRSAGNSRRVAIRTWHAAEYPNWQTPQLIFKLPGKSLERALRQERSRCGQQGYDLNRHIRLLKQARDNIAV
jgi:hypothetical protein